ncbi:hypothetical protein K501DRAFT_288927 [Backusella circina FSU 941]|nr:hypothetical protein K501DRAFT_288927 [Backusella circina FSU 941]
MSTYSKNLFALLSEDGEVRPEPAAPKQEEKKKVEEPKKTDNKKPKDASRNGRGTGRGKRPPRRQFDRHSGTGIVDSEKKVNQGWGHAETAEAEASKDTLDAKDPDAPEKEVAAPAEPEEVVKTLDEYLAEKANKSLKVSLPEARKANDNDDSAFKGAVAHHKEELDDFYVNKDAKSAKKTEKVRKEKVFVDIEQRFEEKSSPRSTGGFRGGNRRGGSDRRGGRGGNSNRRGGSGRSDKSPAINIQDATAFPSLGA